MFVKQVSIFLENTKGSLKKVTQLLRENGIDLIALSIADTRDFGILRTIVSDTEKAVEIVRNAGYAVKLTDVLAVAVPDRPGGLDDVLDLLDLRFLLEDNSFLDPAYVQRLKAEYQGVFYRRFILGQWCVAEGLVYDLEAVDFLVDRVPELPKGRAYRYYISVDYGTLSGRAVLVNARTGQELADAVYEYPHAVMDEQLPCGVKLGTDWALQHPQDYLDVLAHTIPEVLRKSGVSADDVIGIGTDFTACTLLPTKRDGTPLCFLPEYEREPHAYVKLWKHHAAQDKANRLNEIAAARGEAPAPDKSDCLVDITVDAFLPEEYIPDAAGRIEAYKRIAAIETTSDAEDVLDELIDRYGSPPKSVQGLVDVSLVRVTAARVGIAEIVQRGDQLILYSDIVGPKQLGEVMEKFPHRVLYNALGRPYFSLRVQKGESPLVLLRDVVTLLPGAQNQPQTKP